MAGILEGGAAYLHDGDPCSVIPEFAYNENI